MDMATAEREALRSVGRAVRWAQKTLRPELNDAYHALGLCGDLSVANGLRCTRERGHDRVHSAFVELAPCSGPSPASGDYETARGGGWENWG